VLIATDKVDLDLAGLWLISDTVAIATALADPLLDTSNCATVSGVRIHGGLIRTYLSSGIAALICSTSASQTTSATVGVQIDHVRFEGVLELLGANKSVVIQTNYFLSFLRSVNSSGNLISNNLFHDTEMEMYYGGGNTIRDNVFHESACFPTCVPWGIGVFSSSQNLVEGNYIAGVRNGGAGIWLAGPGSTGNVITKNIAFFNIPYDLQDSTDPTCTSNTWSNNFFDRSSPQCIR
jgi:hypothetical protein